jgi:prepilin-type N-terminal cleavage/methylation domain-containing protein
MNRRRRAFTLVEVMLAIAILSMVIACIYATWRSITSATKTGQAAAARVQRTRVALRCIEQALTYTEMYAANAKYYWFAAENGSSANISFVANLPKDFPRSGRFGDFSVRRVSFSIESGSEGGKELVLRQAPLLMDFDEDERQHPLVLMKNIKSLEMEFWDLQKKDWTDQWNETNQIPKLIRVAIITQNPGQPFDRGEQYVRIVAPACAAVQVPWQAGPPGGGQRPPGLVPPGGNTKVRQ